MHLRFFCQTDSSGSDKIAAAIRNESKRPMALELTILVGTTNGIAQLVAQEIELRLESDDLKVTTLPMDELDAGVFARGGLFLICTSTYGKGDVPDNAMTFYQSLQTVRPDLHHVRYGVFALGDMVYAETFCNGGKRFDRLLAELGAKRIGEIALHDLSSGSLPEDEAAQWIEGWIVLCRNAIGVGVSD
jgi:MioC protein